VFVGASACGAVEDGSTVSSAQKTVILLGTVFGSTSAGSTSLAMDTALAHCWSIHCDAFLPKGWRQLMGRSPCLGGHVLGFEESVVLLFWMFALFLQQRHNTLFHLGEQIFSLRRLWQQPCLCALLPLSC